MALEIWMVSAELSPLARTGGLGDVIRALPNALSGLGAHVRRFLPAYGSVDRTEFTEDPEEFEIPLGNIRMQVRFWSKTDPNGVTTTLVACEELFDREEIYGPPGAEYPDNPRRFTFFSRAVCELAHQSHRPPDVIHAHDWPTGLIPLFVKHFYPWPKKRPATVFSIHNMAYQGRYVAWHLQWLSMSEPQVRQIFHPGGIEYCRDMSFMKAGLLYADRLVTVSPTYAADILTPRHGHGLDGVLRDRSKLLVGILNGADEEVWDCATDRYLPKKYDVKSISEGKKAAKRVVQKELGIAVSDRPLLAMLGRFAHQKGLDIVLEAALPIIGQGMDLAIVGAGDPDIESSLLRLRKHLPNRVGVFVGYDDRIAHLAMAGADLAAVPSRYEPCGLTQMHAQMYGTIPVVHRTGGLADTVVDADEHPEEGTGFCFSPLGSLELCEAIRRALTVYTQDPKRWEAIQRSGMKRSFSWSEAGKRYLKIYREIAAQPSTGKSEVLAPAVAR